MKLTLKSLFGGKKQEAEAGPLETDAADLAASRGVDISACKSVCLALGPYRNLTTLTAATLLPERVIKLSVGKKKHALLKAV